MKYDKLVPRSATAPKPAVNKSFDFECFDALYCATEKLLESY